MTVFITKAPELLGGDPTAAAQLGEELIPVMSSVAIPYLVWLVFGIWWVVLMCRKSVPDNQYGPNPYGEF